MENHPDKEIILEKPLKYRENNKEKMKKYRKDYNEKNKEKHKEKFNCDCGSKIRFNDKARHFKSKKHQKFILESKTL